MHLEKDIVFLADQEATTLPIAGGSVHFAEEKKTRARTVGKIPKMKEAMGLHLQQEWLTQKRSEEEKGKEEEG